MKLNQLREFVKQVVREEQDYQQLFKHMLDKSGKSLPNMSDDEKKKFFNAVDTAYKAKSEGRLRGYNEGLSKDAIVSTLSRDKNAYFLTKDGNGWILDITPKAAQQSTFHQKFDVKDLGKGHLGMKYKLSELTAGQKKIDVDGDGEIEGSDLAKLRAQNESVIKEGRFDADLDKIESAVKNATSFMNVGSELKKAGIKYDFTTSMIPMYMIKVSGNTIAICNKKYAAGAERTVNDIAIGLLN